MVGVVSTNGLTRTGDLGAPPPIEGLRWDEASCEASLAAVYQHVAGGAETAIAWYLRAKRPKQHLAAGIRGGAICLAALAGIIPMLAEIPRFKGLDPVWASIVLGLAAALVMLDRFFGFSSGWVRYISTELHLRQILDEFRLDWETQKAGWKAAALSDEQVQKALAICHAFAAQVNGIVREETNLWVAEFQDSLKQLDETVKARLAAAVPGAVSLVVTNGDQCDSEWTVSIDDGAARVSRGKTVALPGLLPGIHTVRVEGAIRTKLVKAEKPVSVAAGGVTSVEVALS
jgi:hypothetical protein